MKRAFFLLALLIGAQSFEIFIYKNSKNHQDITRSAILQATAKACESVPNYKKPAILNSKTLAEACRKGTSENFELGIDIISYNNVMTDGTEFSSPEHHFDNEKFAEGKQLIIKGIDDVKEFVKKNAFEKGRATLGKILHTLQDFYSHSNWIELGNTEPCTALINLKEIIPNTADKTQKTCETTCEKKNCRGNILPDIIRQKILTSGYFSLNPTASKPTGKCSHGGVPDQTTGFLKSADGINKDTSESSHGSSHEKATGVAIKASVQLLEKIRKSIEKEDFFRLVGLHLEKPKDEWKTHIPFINFKERYLEGTGDKFVEV